MTNCSGCISLQLPLLLQDHLPQSPPAFPHAPLHCPSLFPRYRHPMSCGKCWNSPAPSSHFHCHSQSSTAAPSNPDSRTMSVQLFQTMHSHLPSGSASDPPCLSSHSHSGPCGSDLSSHGHRWQNAGCFHQRSPQCKSAHRCCSRISGLSILLQSPHPSTDPHSGQSWNGCTAPSPQALLLRQQHRALWKPGRYRRRTNRRPCPSHTMLPVHNHFPHQTAQRPPLQKIPRPAVPAFR